MEIEQGRNVVKFYNSFPLDLERLSSALDAITGQPITSSNELATVMNVNYPIGRSYRGWLTHTFLGQSFNNTIFPTAFGQMAHTYDPTLRDIGTLWILHYYLSTTHNERSEAWWQLFNAFLLTQTEFELSTFVNFFNEVAGADIGNKKALEDDPKVAVRTYTREQGLGRLGILTELKGSRFALESRIEHPHPLVVGYILLDGWTRRYGNQLTVPFSLLYEEPESLGRVLLASPRQVKQWVADLSHYRVLTYAETQHEPVNRLAGISAIDLLERYYKER